MEDLTMYNTTLSLLKKRLKAMQKLIYKTFVAYDSVSYFELYAKDRSCKVVYQNTTDDFATDSDNLFNLLRQADLLIQKINKQEIKAVTNN
jgi:hypothetical protein